MRNKTFIILVFILIIASVLRFWQLGKTPISPDWDEVSLGYNAYSIMQTGRDEYGEFLPVVLRSFDDYKPALYVYLSIPSISILGLTVEAVRLPSAVFGVITVLAVFFLVSELFKRKDLALLSSFLLAISPMSIQFSRIAFESNVGLAFNVLSILFFVKGLKNPVFLILSAVFAGLNIYVYQSEKIFTPLLFLIAFIIFRKELFSKPAKYIIASFIIGLLVVLPMVGYILTNKNALERAKGVSIFGEPYPHGLLQKILDDKEKGDLLDIVFDNRRVVYAKNIISGYLSHFDANWLFVRGDIARHHAPNMGLLYLFELPFLLIGIYGFVFGKFDKKGKLLIIGWFLIAPISASVTREVPHAVRTLNFLPAFQIFTAIGILFAMQKISNIKYPFGPSSRRGQISNIQMKYLIFSLCILFFIFNFSYYINQYFVQQNYFLAKYWQYGYKELVDYLKPQYKQYNKVIVSNRGPFNQSYMFFLFYLKYDPHKYLSNRGTSSGGFKESGNKFDNFEFRPFNYYSEKGSNILLIGGQDDFAEVFHTVKEINYPDKSLAIKVVEKNR